MPNTNDTKILLNIKDENIDIIKPIEEKRINGLTTIIAYGKLTYTPECCSKCGVVNESALDVIKCGFKQTIIKVNPNNYRKCLLKLKKQRFYCKHCHETFTAETSLAKKHCQISNPVRNAITVELSLVGPMTSIAKRQQVSSSTLIRLLVGFAKPLETKQIHLPEHLSIDEFKSVKSVEGAMSFNFIDAVTHRFIDVVENRQLHALESYFMK